MRFKLNFVVIGQIVQFVQYYANRRCVMAIYRFSKCLPSTVFNF